MTDRRSAQARSPARSFAQLALACLVALAAPASGSLAAEREATWKVSGKLYGEPDEDEPERPKESKKARDVSGIACATDTGFPRVCLVADDESQGAQVVILREGELIAGRFIRLIDASHKDKPLELDAEGVAYADGAFYVIGSHGRPRHEKGHKEAKNEASTKATRHLFRIRLDVNSVNLETGKFEGKPEIEGTSALLPIIADIPALKAFYDKPLEDGGLTIEGIAVRDGRLYAGLRGPVLNDGNASIVSVPLAGLFEGKPSSGTLAKVPLGADSRGQPRGVRDLVAVPDGFLVLAGPMLDPDNDEVATADYTIFSWNGRDGLHKRRDLDAGCDAVKPEALLPLDQKDGRLRVLLLFDGPKEGAPRTVTLNP